MKTNILTSLFILFSSVIYSQTAYLDAEIILNTNDTLNTQVRVVTNLFDREYVNELSFHKKIKTKSVDGSSKNKILEEDVKSIRFIDLKNQERLFISDKCVPEIEFRDRLIEEVIKGKITWYRLYTPHGYDKSVMATEFFLVKNKPVESATMRAGIIKKLKKLIGGNLELDSQIEKIKTKEDILAVLKNYNN